MILKTVCVFCASSDGVRPEYRAAAAALGADLAAHGIGLVYGGSKVGLMGAVAESCLQHGGNVVGVIPHVLVDMEVSNEHCSELHVVDTMHTRKALMADKADAFLILPGGYGTLEEMFEVLAWQGLGIHAKPVCLLNLAGFYDDLLRFLEHCEQEGVLKPALRKNLLVASTLEEAFVQMGR